MQTVGVLVLWAIVCVLARKLYFVTECILLMLSNEVSWCEADSMHA